MIFDVLEKTPKGKGGEVQLTDAITMSGPCRSSGRVSVQRNPT